MFGKQWETWPFIVDYNLEKEMDSLVQWRDRSITYHNGEILIPESTFGQHVRPL